MLVLHEPDVAHRNIWSSPHKRQVPLQLFVGVGDGVALGQAVQGVGPWWGQDPGAPCRQGTEPPGPDPSTSAVPMPFDTAEAASLEQETHEVPRTSNRHWK